MSRKYNISLVIFLVLAMILKDFKLIKRTQVIEYFPFLFYSGIFVNVILFFSCVFIFAYGKRLNWANFYNRSILLILPIILIPQILTCMMAYKESYISLVRLLVLFYGGYFLYFFMVFAKVRIQEFNIVFKAIVFTSILLVLVTILQSIGIGNFILHESQRFGDVRISAPTTTFLFAFSYSFAMLYHKEKNKKIVGLGLLCAIMYYIVFIAKTRQFYVLVALFVIWFIGLCIKNNRETLRWLLGYIMISTLLFLAVPSLYTKAKDIMVQSYKDVVYEAKTSSDTVGGRMDGIKYYMNIFFESAFIGIGWPDETVEYAESLDATYISSGYSLNDTGFLEILLRWGFLGVLLVAVLLFRVESDIRKGLQLLKNEDALIARSIWFFIVFVLLGIVANKPFLFHQSTYIYAFITFYAYLMLQKRTNATLRGQYDIK